MIYIDYRGLCDIYNNVVEVSGGGASGVLDEGRIMGILGMYLYFLGFTAILVLLRFIFAHTALTKTWLYSPMGLKAVGLGAILFVTGMCIYGMVHAVHIYTTRYEVPSKKDAHLKIALVADLHLGYSIGSHQMEEMVEKSMLRSRMSL